MKFDCGMIIANKVSLIYHLRKMKKKNQKSRKTFLYTVCHPQAEMDEAQIRVKDAFCMVMLIGNQVERPCESPEEREILDQPCVSFPLCALKKPKGQI